MKKITIAIWFMCSLASGLRAADWLNWPNFSSITAMAQNGSSLWVAGRGGIAVIDTATMQKTFYKKTAGQLPSLMVEDMTHCAVTNTTWIGTYDNGLVAFNNNQFVRYAYPDSDLRLYHIATDTAGNVWCAMNTGLYKFHNGTFTEVLVSGQSIGAWDVKAFSNGKLLLASTTPMVYDPIAGTMYTPNTNIFAYSDAKIEIRDDTSYYFASDHGGIIYVHDTTVVDVSDSTVADNFDPRITQLRRLASGTLLALRTDSKVFAFNGASWSPYANSAGAEAAQATFLFQKKSGEVITGGIEHGGTVKSLSGTGTVEIAQSPIWTNRINTVSEKSDHELWIMGGNQIGLYNINTASFTHIDTLSGAIASNNGDITAWNGSYIAFAYNTLYQWNGTTWAPLTIAGLPANNILCMTTDASGTLYVGTFYGLYIVSGTTVTHYDANNTPVLNNNDLIRAIHYDASRSTLWMATSHGIVKLVSNTFSVINSTNTPQLTYYDYISAITQDPMGNMWFGTAYGGLIEYDGTDYTLEILPGSIGNQSVNAIRFDGNTMYVGDNVFGFWIRENGSWTNYNTKNSDMTCNYLTSLYVDRNHNVWLTSYDYGSQSTFGVDVYNKTAVALSVRNINGGKTISVYPNPVSSQLTISDLSVKDGDKVTLTDAVGRDYSYTVSARRIDMSSLATGIYILSTHAGAAPVRIIKD